MFPSFSVPGQLHARARQIMFLVQFQCSNKFGSVRSALHQRVIARTIQCNWSTLGPDLKSLNGLLPTVWAMRSKRDVLPSPIVPLPLAPFSVLGTPSRYHFQCLQTSKAIRMLDQLLDGHQNCCMWPSQNLTMPPSVQEWKCKQAGINMPFFGLCRPRAFCVGATIFKDSLVTILAAVVDSHLQIQSYKLNNAIKCSFVSVMERDVSWTAVLLWLPMLWLGASHAKASESREEVLQKNKQ